MRSIDAFREIVAGERSRPRSRSSSTCAWSPPRRATVTFELEAGPQHASPLGTLHGGIICDVADAALGCAHASLLAEGETFTTLELKINFMKPVWSGRLTAVGQVIKSGRTIGLTECRVTDESGSLVAYATSTCMTLRGDSAQGR